MPTWEEEEWERLGVVELWLEGVDRLVGNGEEGGPGPA